jgi:hypothetical protein
MGTPRNIRFPDDLLEEIEKARIEDKQANFTDEVVYLVRLGLEEAEWLRAQVAEAKMKRRGEAPRKAAGE